MLIDQTFPVNTKYQHDAPRFYLLHFPHLNMPDEEQNKGEQITKVSMFWVLNLMMQFDQYEYRWVSQKGFTLYANCTVIEQF